MTRMKTTVAAAALALCIAASLPARAQESDAGYTYSPDGCEFEITLPGEPFSTRRCHDEMPDKCALMTGYTQVFNLDATVNFYVSCKPDNTGLRKQFTPDLMRTSLLARPDVQQLQVYDISYNDTKEALMGALFGAGQSKSGGDEMIYVTQLWIGDNSVMTFEGEMIGQDIPEAEEMFAKVMASLHVKTAAAGEEKPEPEESAKKEDAEPKPAPAP